MPTLGQTLRNAREKKGVSASEAAAATRIMVQMIEKLEDDDFSNIAASIYGKGFIRLYAEFLGLDPEPLVAEYSGEKKSGAESRVDSGEGRDRADSISTDAHAGSRDPKAVAGIWDRTKLSIIEEPLKTLFIGLAILVLLVFLISGLTR